MSEQLVQYIIDLNINLHDPIKPNWLQTENNERHISAFIIIFASSLIQIGRKYENSLYPVGIV